MSDPEFFRRASGALWLAWFLCWGGMALFAKPDRMREPLTADLPVLLGSLLTVTALFTPRAMPGWTMVRLLPVVPALDWAGLIAQAVGMVFAVWARLALGRNWSGRVTLKEDHQLVITGPYRWVRHPIYTGLLLGLLGLLELSARVWCLAALALFGAGFVQRVGREERLMVAEFGDAYRAYQARTRALVPGLW